MKDKLLSIEKDALEKINSAIDKEKIENLRVKYLGKKGELTLLLREMGKLSKEERPVMGKLSNEVRDKIEKVIEAKFAEIEERELERKLEAEKIDITFRKEGTKLGHRSPLKKTLEDLEDLFV